MRHEKGTNQSDLIARLANVDLNLLPTLLVLLQERSVTAAANRIGMSQPAISHSLARLRALLHDELLVRSGNKSVLTPRAIGLVEVVSQLLNNVSESVLHYPHFNASVDRRHFTLSMTSSTAYVVSPVLLQIIATRAPRVSFEIVESAEPGSDVFARPQIDIALLADAVTTSYHRTRLYVDRWVAIADAANSRVASPLALDDLARSPHIAYRSPTVRTQPYVVMAAAGISPRFDLVSNNFLLIALLVAGTNRLAIVQERLALGLASRFSLIILDLPLNIPPLGMDLVMNPRLGEDAATLWLTQTLRQHMAFAS